MTMAEHDPKISLSSDDVRASLLALDPDLGARMAPDRYATAARRILVRVGALRAGAWEPREGAFGAEGGIGLLIVEGFMLRRIGLEHRSAAEILGPGDLLRPWQDDGEHAVYPYTPGWRVVRPMEIAILDLEVAERLGPYPELVASLVGRAMSRSRRVAGHLVLAQLGSVEHRVLLALWHLSDLWGRVRVDGIALPVPLTHEMLGLLVGARRPVVTTALGTLGEKDLVRPLDGGGYLLTGEPPSDLHLVRGSRRER